MLVIFLTLLSVFFSAPVFSYENHEDYVQYSYDPAYENMCDSTSLQFYRKHSSIESLELCGCHLIGEFLILKPIQDIPYVLQTSPFNSIDSNFFPWESVQNVGQDFDYAWGFRVGIDFSPSDTCLGADIKYTYYHPNISSKLFGDSDEQTLVPPFVFLGSFDTGAPLFPIAEAKSSWQIDYDLLDLSGKFFLLNEGIKFAPIIGIRGVILNQGGVFTYRNGSQQLLGEFDYRHHFYGGGLDLGVFGELLFEPCVKISGRFNASAVYGHYDIKIDGKYVPSVLLYDDILNGVYKAQFNRLIQVYQWAIEAEVFQRTCCYKIGFSLGIEGEIWSQYLQNPVLSLNSQLLLLEQVARFSESPIFFDNPKDFALVGVKGGVNISF